MPFHPARITIEGNSMKGDEMLEENLPVAKENRNRSDELC
jgi:hypothetical protein